MVNVDENVHVNENVSKSDVRCSSHSILCYVSSRILVQG